MTEAAARMGCSRQWVHYLITNGRLKAELIGGIYILREKDLKACRVRPREKPESKNGHNSALPQKRSSVKKGSPKVKAAKLSVAKRSR